MSLAGKSICRIENSKFQLVGKEIEQDGENTTHTEDKVDIVFTNTCLLRYKFANTRTAVEFIPRWMTKFIF